MRRPFKLAFLAASFVALCAAAPVVQRMHPATRAPQASTLPAPHYVGTPATRLARVYGGTKIDVRTYHYDLNRTGWNPTETDLTPASVASSNFGLLATLKVDGNVLAQPLLVSNFQLSSSKTIDLLIIATGHNSVYAYNAQTYQLVWHVNLGTSQSSNDVGCGDVVPEYGISSTPVIVRNSANYGVIYVVAATEPSPDVFVSQIHALKISDGVDVYPPVTISPSTQLSDGSTVTFDPQNQWNRPALAFTNGSLYVGIGSHCDSNSGNITGWLLRYSGALSPLAAFPTIKTHGGTELASIWMTGFAPAFDTSGNIYFATGNGDYQTGKMDWGQSVLKMNPALSTIWTSFTEANYNSDSNNDLDLGSGGVMLLPTVTGQTAPPMAVQMGKSGTLYLMNQHSLGGLKANDAGVLQAQICCSGLWGGPAYYDGPSGPTVFVQGDGSPLLSWSVATGSSPSLTLGKMGSSNAGYGGSLPIVSSNGAAANSGVLWLVNRAQEPFSVEAYDANLLGAPIFSAQVGTWSNASNGNPFLTPMEANGRVYVPGYLLVQVYGLAQ